MFPKTTNITIHTCDVCKKTITDTDDAFLAWSDNGNGWQYRFGKFFIAHRTCYGNSYMEMDLTSAIHSDGLAKLIVMLEEGIVEDLASFTEVMKRLYLPYYEGARPYLQIAKADGFFEGASPEAILTQQNLLDVIRVYGSKDELEID